MKLAGLTEYETSITSTCRGKRATVRSGLALTKRSSARDKLNVEVDGRGEEIDCFYECNNDGLCARNWRGFSGLHGAKSVSVGRLHTVLPVRPDEECQARDQNDSNDRIELVKVLA